MTSDYAKLAESVAISGPNRLVARFGKAYISAKEFCERPERKAKLEQALGNVAGTQIGLGFELLEGDAGQGLAPRLQQPTPANRQQRFLQAAQHPLVRQAMELFDAEVVSVAQPAVEESETGSGGAPGGLPPG